MVTMAGGGLTCDREAVLGMLFIKPSQRSCELGTRTKFFFWMGKPRPKDPKSFAPVKQQEAQLGLCQGLPSTLFSGVCTETIPTRVFLARISSVKYAFDSLHGSRFLLVACDPKNIFSGFFPALLNKPFQLHSVHILLRVFAILWAKPHHCSMKNACPGACRGWT